MNIYNVNSFNLFFKLFYKILYYNQAIDVPRPVGTLYPQPQLGIGKGFKKRSEYKFIGVNVSLKG